LSGTHRVAASEIRAKLDDIQPYEDLDIVDVGSELAALYADNESAAELGYDDQLEMLGLSGS
jgi:hypothetical protein